MTSQLTLPSSSTNILTDPIETELIQSKELDTAQYNGSTPESGTLGTLHTKDNQVTETVEIDTGPAPKPQPSISSQAQPVIRCSNRLRKLKQFYDPVTRKSAEL